MWTAKTAIPSPAFLDREVKSQCGSVFNVPAAAAMIAVYLLFILLAYGNDGQIVFSEVVALSACLGSKRLSAC